MLSEATCPVVLQRVAIKKQFFLAALQLAPPNTFSSESLNTSTSSVEASLQVPLNGASSFSRISVTLAAPTTQGHQDASTISASAPAPADSEPTDEYLATDENMRVFLELKAIVPLQFGASHAVHTTRLETHTLMVRCYQTNCSCNTLPIKHHLSCSTVALLLTAGMHASGTVRSD